MVCDVPLSQAYWASSPSRCVWRCTSARPLPRSSQRAASSSCSSASPPSSLRCVAHNITSHRIASHHITSHRITSHRITSHRITSHHIASHHITSHHITSHHITSHHIASQYITSHRIASHHIACPRHHTAPPPPRRPKSGGLCAPDRGCRGGADLHVTCAVCRRSTATSSSSRAPSPRGSVAPSSPSST
jgi:hypothetical protein